MKIKGMYTGSFDPITNGHINIIERGSKLFEKFYVVIAYNKNKNTLFDLNERYELVKEVVKNYKNIEVLICDKLIVDFAEENDIKYMLRGLRAVTDFEYELQMADTNKVLNENIETIFIMANKEYSYVSSSLVKEIASFHGKIDDFVPNNVLIALKNKFKK